jgi:hypothetical protein
MPFFVDQAKLELEPLTPGEISGANEVPPPTFWNHLASQGDSETGTVPTGAIIGANEIAPGILWFKTATRSVYRLSPRQQRAFPHDFRTEDRWCEETSEWAADAVVSDRIFARMPASAINRRLSTQARRPRRIGIRKNMRAGSR